MSLGDLVRFHRRRLKINQDQLAELVVDKGGTASQSTISDIETGKSVDPHCVPQLAEIFGVTEKELRNGANLPLKANVREHPQPVGESPSASPTESRDKSVAKVITFLGRRAESRGAGVWLIYPERTAGRVELGPFLSQAPRSFKVEVLDEHNSPVYEPRDILWCDPELQPIEGKNYCVFVGENGVEDDGGIPAMLGKLVSQDQESWVMKPYVAEPITLPKAAWRYAWVVYRVDRDV